MSLITPPGAGGSSKHFRTSSSASTGSTGSPVTPSSRPSSSSIAAKRVMSATLKPRLSTAKSPSNMEIKEATAVVSPKSPAQEPSPAEEQSVVVCVRVRPLIARERELKAGVCCTVSNPKTLTISDRSKNVEDKPFTFDSVFSPTDNQETVYNRCVQPVVASFLEGFNATVFAYGQTGSGKTWTVHGDVKTPGNAGIAWRTAHQIIQFVEAKRATHDVQLEAMFLELYQERLIDLLVDEKGADELVIREHPTEGVYVAGARTRVISTIDDIMRLIDEGNSRRSVAETKMNEASSRSHSVLTIRLTQSAKDDTWVRTHSQLHLIDLAGSERVETTGAVGQRLKEGAQINASLSALGNVIKKLAEGSPHVPFRDSKLTRILSQSLGGNCKTLLIANLSPADCNASESLSTLRFAARAKLIKNHAVLGQSPEVQKRLELQQQVAALQKRIQELEALSPSPDAGSALDIGACSSCGHQGSRVCSVCLNQDPMPCARCPHTLRAPAVCMSACLCGGPAPTGSAALRLGQRSRSVLAALGVVFIALLIALLVPAFRNSIGELIVHCPEALYQPSRLDLAIDFVVDRVAGLYTRWGA